VFQREVWDSTIRAVGKLLNISEKRYLTFIHESTGTVDLPVCEMLATALMPMHLLIFVHVVTLFSLIQFCR